MPGGCSSGSLVCPLSPVPGRPSARGNFSQLLVRSGKGRGLVGMVTNPAVVVWVPIDCAGEIVRVFLHPPLWIGEPLRPLCGDVSLRNASSLE